MKIKSIETKNHKILGNIKLNFCDINEEVMDTIIIAGENGTGKSTILNLLYKFSQYAPLTEENQIIIVVVKINEEELKLLQKNKNISSMLTNGIKDNSIIFTFDTINNKINDWKNITSEWQDLTGVTKKVYALNFTDVEIKPIFRSIYSDVEINFNPRSISSVTSKNIDDFVPQSIKSQENLATEITQLLIDIQALDDSDMGNWNRNNIGKPIPENLIDIRTKRFKNAFEKIFPLKKYLGVKNISNMKKVIFQEAEKEMSIEELSSGEKQIVFRGSFCLKDKNNNNGVFALIDEPEISLHPIWQSKIVQFYQEIFSNMENNTNSQIFIATHSPFILHNSDRKNDKVIILKKGIDGKPELCSERKYYGWTNEELVKEAFNLNSFKRLIQQETGEHIIVTEGKTDWKHLKRAFNKMKETGKYDGDLYFFEYGDEIEMGDKNLISFCEQLSKIENTKKIICIFDRDVSSTLTKIEGIEGNVFKKWGNNVFSLAIPVPPHRNGINDICIEHYYFDEEIKTYDENKRRLYMSVEFRKKSGLHISENVFCIEKNKLGKDNMKIIDNGVFFYEDEENNIALSKEKFASNILNENELFRNIKFEQFKPIFDVVEIILKS